MSDAAASSNKDSLAVLGNEVKHLRKSVDANTSEVREWRRELNGRVRVVELEQASLKAQVRNWNGVNSIGVIIAGILAALGIRE